VRERALLEANASSLIEMFAPGIIADRVKGMLKGYDFISRECDVLWAQIDALHHAYVEPRHIPAGAFRPEALP
jgi:hypothetical protein